MALRLTGNRRYPSLPAITEDIRNHTEVLRAVKESLELAQRRTPDVNNSFVRVQELIDLGLVTLEGNTSNVVGADLSEIADIGDLSAAAEGDFLRYRSGEWINDQLDPTDITQAFVTQHQAALSIAYSQLTSKPALIDSLDDLVDPNADRILFWDDSAGTLEWLTLGTNLSITGTTINASGGGVTDHGALTGLADDDHTQYAEHANSETITGAWIYRAPTTTPSWGQVRFQLTTGTGVEAAIAIGANAGSQFLHNTLFDGTDWRRRDAGFAAGLFMHEGNDRYEFRYGVSGAANAVITWVYPLIMDNSTATWTCRHLAPDGSESAPAYSFSGATTSGLWISGTTFLGFSVGGTSRFEIAAAQVRASTTAGTAGAPSYSFIGDTNTGLYRSAADTLGLSTAGTRRMLINSAGEFGINVDPTSGVPFRIQSAGNADAGIEFQRSSATRMVQLSYNRTGAAYTDLELAFLALELKPSGGSVTFKSDTDYAAIQRQFLLSGTISPSFTGTQNDYAPTSFSGASVVRLSGSTTPALGGLTGGTAGRLVLLINVGATAITINDENAGSTAANRFATHTNANITLNAEASIWIWYDGTSSRWRTIGL